MTQSERGAAISLVLGAAFIAGAGQLAQGDGTDRIIWFTKPASNWQREALPLGNGRLGWADGQLVEAVILATQTGRCTVRYRDKTATLDMQAGQRRVIDQEL